MPPLRRNWFHILTALADRDVHGSGIARDVKRQTDGSLTLWPATLYRTLDDMTAAGLIVELTGDRHPDGESAKRRYYRSTDEGRRALSEAAQRMSGWAGLAEHRLGRRPS
jgi:DNA-binding PadR family transcriptional regulator